MKLSLSYKYDNLTLFIEYRQPEMAPALRRYKVALR